MYFYFCIFIYVFLPPNTKKQLSNNQSQCIRLNNFVNSSNEIVCKNFAIDYQLVIEGISLQAAWLLNGVK